MAVTHRGRPQSHCVQPRANMVSQCLPIAIPAPWRKTPLMFTRSPRFGKPYHLEFVDLVRFNSQGKIAQIKEFLDSGHLQHHIEQHESKHGLKVEIRGHIPTVKETTNKS